MSWTNYHSHCHYCDGTHPPDAYARQAVAAGMRAYGFSSHAPLPFATSWAMPAQKLTDYRADIARLQRTHAGQIELYAGLEVDFIPGLVSLAEARGTLDYVIGSVHFVDAFADGNGWEIDGQHALFRRGLAEIFDNDARAAVSRYFALTRQMVSQARPDVVGHLDKIKIQTGGGTLFAETDDWYRAEVRHTLRCLADAQVLVEVNTRGIYKKKTPETYPSQWVLGEMHALGIPVVLNSDAHHPREITAGFAPAAALLHRVGYRHLHALLDGHWQARPFDKQGPL